MRTLEQVINNLPPARRAKVLARSREIVDEQIVGEPTQLPDDDTLKQPR
jgi:hypothetical protein